MLGCANGKSINAGSDLLCLDQGWELVGQGLPGFVVRIRESRQRESLGKKSMLRIVLEQILDG